MTTLTIQALSADQETAICIFLDALHVPYYASDDTDETSYLLSSAANAEHLQRSMGQGERGETTTLGLDDVWKP